ncbi:MAG: histidine phosphatase family protein [bacterium]|nr:histidine phosphatase family protein [bacterium]
MSRKILFIRHGQTAGNMEKRYVGITDEPLCDAGRLTVSEKKRMLRDHAKHLGDNHVLLAVSPMLRCVETATTMFPNVKQQIIDDFREMDFGQFEYKNYLELEGNPDYQRFIDSGGKTDFPGAEKREDFRNRCCRAFERFCCEHMHIEEDIRWVFVVHGGTIMSILERYALPHKDFYDWQIQPGECIFCTLACNPKTERFDIKVETII